MEDEAVVERLASPSGRSSGRSMPSCRSARPTKFATVMGALSANSLNLNVPSVVSNVAVVMRMILSRVMRVLTLVLGLVGCAVSAQAPPAERFVIRVPEQWNGGVVIGAHGGSGGEAIDRKGNVYATSETALDDVIGDYVFTRRFAYASVDRNGIGNSQGRHRANARLRHAVRKRKLPGAAVARRSAAISLVFPPVVESHERSPKLRRHHSTAR